MKMALVRHGNTFEPGERSVWVGARSDLPLVLEGREQAARIGNAFATVGLKLQAIYCGPLKRTMETAKYIAVKAAVEEDDIIVAEYLCEIDYGMWEGKSNDEIRSTFGDAAIDSWQKRNIWPTEFGWSPEPGKILENWGILQKEAEERYGNDTVCVVSSNGIFKIIASCIGISPEASKMNTGSISMIKVDDKNIEVVFWNKKPNEIKEFAEFV